MPIVDSNITVEMSLSTIQKSEQYWETWDSCMCVGTFIENDIRVYDMYSAQSLVDASLYTFDQAYIARPRIDILNEGTNDWLLVSGSKECLQNHCTFRCEMNRLLKT